jgi:shikimate dehydrogenase
MSDRYVLLGGNVSNSPSPRMMNAALRALGLDAVYLASNVPAAELGRVFAELKETGVRGANVTIPHKTSIRHLLDSLDEISSKIGAVNTVKNDGGSFIGYNTDVDGILGPLKSKGLSRINRAIVVGTGGAARAFCAAMRDQGCTELAIFSRNPARANGFLTSMRAAFPEIKIDFASTYDHSSWSPDLFFNASPAGTNGTKFPAEAIQFIKSRPVVFEAVYFPVETELIKLARQFGCTPVYGHEMLLQQGLKSLQIWTGRAPPVNVMRSELLGFLGVALH